MRTSPGPLPFLPRLLTTAESGGRSDVLRRTRGDHHLALGLWCVCEEPPTHLQQAVLLREHLSRGRPPLRLTGVTALQLLDLPVPRGRSWVTALLHDRPAPHGPELVRHLDSLVHLAWDTARFHSRLPQLRISRSHGLPTVLGPWLAHLVDPVEALVVAAPILDPWAITATLDALLSRGPLPRAVVATPTSTAPPPSRAPVHGVTRSSSGNLSTGGPSNPASERGESAPLSRPRRSEPVVPVTYTPEIVRALLEPLPLTSHGVRAVSRALGRTAPRMWSPMETLVRLIVVAAGFPAPVMNVTVRTPYGTRHLDLGWEEEMVAVEFNGQVHSTDHAAYKDEMHRLEVLRDLGWAVRVLVYDDLVDPRRRGEWLTWLSRRLSPPRPRRTRRSSSPRARTRPSARDESEA